MPPKGQKFPVLAPGCIGNRITWANRAATRFADEMAEEKKRRDVITMAIVETVSNSTLQTRLPSIIGDLFKDGASDIKLGDEECQCLKSVAEKWSGFITMNFTPQKPEGFRARKQLTTVRFTITGHFKTHGN